LRKLALFPVLLLLYLACSGNYHVGHTGDDVMYLSTGRALAQGLGYVDLHFPDHPPHLKYPPGYPLLLAVGEWLWPGSLTAARCLNLGVTLATVAVVWLALAELPPPYRQAGTVLTGVNVLWAEFATTVDSAPLYALCLALAMLACQRGARLGVAVCVAAAVYVRTVGIVLFPSLALERRFWGALLLAMLCLAPYYLNPVRLTEYRRAGMTTPVFGESGLAAGRHVALNLGIPLMLWGNPWVLTSHAQVPKPALVLLSLAGWVLLGRGAWVCLRSGSRGARSAAALAASTLALHAVYAYFDYRYYVPVLPYLYWLLLEGCRAFNRRALTVAVVGSCLVGNLAFAALDAHRTLTAPERPPYAAAYAWLAANRQPGDIISAESPAVWLYTGLPVVYLLPAQAAQHPEEWLKSLDARGVTLVLLPTMDPFCEFVARHFTPVHLEEGAVVFRRPARPTGASGSP